jgi:hypothetical protein
MMRRQGDQLVAPAHKQRIGTYQQRRDLMGGERFENRVEVAVGQKSVSGDQWPAPPTIRRQ